MLSIIRCQQCLGNVFGKVTGDGISYDMKDDVSKMIQLSFCSGRKYSRCSLRRFLLSSFNELIDNIDDKSNYYRTHKKVTLVSGHYGF